MASRSMAAAALLLSLLPGALAAVCEPEAHPEARLMTMARSCFQFNATPESRNDVDKVIYKHFGAGGSTEGLAQPADAAACLAAARKVVDGKCWGLEFPSYFLGSDVYVRTLLWVGLKSHELRFVQNCSWSVPDVVDSEEPAATLRCPANGGLITYNYPGLRRGNLSLLVEPQCGGAAATVVVGDFAGGGFSVLEEKWEKRRLLCQPMAGKGCWGNETGTARVPAGESARLRLFVPWGGEQTYMGRVSWRAICEEAVAGSTSRAVPSSTRQPVEESNESTTQPSGAIMPVDQVGSGAVRMAGCLGVLALGLLAL